VVKMMIYPYGQKEKVFGRLAEMINKELVLVSPKGWGYAGKDVSFCDGGKSGGQIVEENPKEGLRRVEEVLFLNSMKLSSSHYMELIECAQGLKRQISIDQSLADRLYQDGYMEKLCNIAVLGQEKNCVINENIEECRCLFRIPVPVIAVAGVGEGCDQFELLLAAGGYFQKQGYRTLMLGTREYASAFGAECLPAFVWEENDESLRKNIVYLNSYVYERVRETKADILLIEIPGDLMQLNPYFFEDFGEKAIMVHTAVPADAGVLSMYAHPYTVEFLEHLKGLCRYRYNMPVDVFHVSNTSFEVSLDTFEKEYMTLSSEDVMDKYMDKAVTSKYPLFHWHEEEQLQCMCKELERKLTSSI